MQPDLLESVHQVNVRQRQQLFNKISKRFDGKLKGLSFAIWGVSFKPRTDDMREAASRVLIEALWAAGAKVQAYDPEAMEESRDVRVIGIVIEHLVKEPFESAIVNDGQDAKRTIVQLVGRDVPREIIQRGVQVIAADALLRLFPPRPQPSSESWRRAQRRGGPSRDANWPRGRVIRLPPPDAPPWPRPGVCSGSWEEPGPTCPR